MHRRVPPSPGPARVARVALAAGTTVLLLSVTAAGPASATGRAAAVFRPSGGTPIPTSTHCVLTAPVSGPGGIPAPLNCAKAGYQATGRDFRYAQALITVPDHHGVLGDDAGEADPQLYVALDNSTSGSNQFARVGVQPCTGGPDCDSTGWEAYAQVVGGISPPGTPPTLFPITPVAAGDGVFVSIYYDPAGLAVHTVVTLPDGSTIHTAFADRGMVYSRAQAVADWTSAEPKPQPISPTPAQVRDTQFTDGRFTTVSGQRGTFAGPWTLNAFEGTSNAVLPPAGTLVVQPSYLWTDGASLDGRFGDAFGVWRYPS